MLQDYAQVPTDITEFKQIAAGIPSWDLKKTYSDVKTFTKWIGDNFWGARASIHANPPFDSFKAALYENHTENEAQYMHIISNYRQLDAPEPWKSYEIEYTLPFPLGKRTFVIWILAEQISDSEFFVLTIPRSSDLPGARGRYISVETVKYTDQGTEWTMGTSADAGGIPQFIQRWSLPGTLAKDVPAVLNFISSKHFR